MNFAFAMESAVSHAMDIAVNRMNPLEWLLFIGLTALEVILIVISGGYGLAVRLAEAAVVAFTNAAIMAVADYTDSNGTPCITVLQAISQFNS